MQLSLGLWRGFDSKTKSSVDGEVGSFSDESVPVGLILSADKRLGVSSIFLSAHWADGHFLHGRTQRSSPVRGKVLFMGPKSLKATA